MEKVKEILNFDLSHSDIKDVSMFRNVHTLSLRGCENIKDVSMLGSVHDLNLSLCKKLSRTSFY